ncbi:hypothetical protein ACP70R_026921 [Stipagrostis hirtigluma subsp. patula]
MPPRPLGSGHWESPSGGSVTSAAGIGGGEEGDIPPSIDDDDDWCGVATGTGLRCIHGLRPRRRICWDGNNTGRRFLGCGLEEEEGRCRFVKWCDPEYTIQVQAAITALWDVVGDFRAMELEARRELARTKKVAKNACEFYESKYQTEAAEKKMACFVAFLVGGLIATAVVALVMKTK